MPGRDIVVIGASAGGVETLSQFVKELPADLPAAVFVVLHFPPTSTSVLPGILSRKGAIPAVHAENGAAIEPGRIYVGPPDRHLLLRGDGMHLVRGPRENGHRPAVDPLFRSAARSFGRRVIGVILSGTLDDGASGLADVKRMGGMALVQDPAEALYSGMPENAIQHARVDHVAPIVELAALLDRLTREPLPQIVEQTVADEIAREDEISAFQLDEIQDPNRPGIPGGFGCPDCGGALWEIPGESSFHFRCRVGHAWAPDSLLHEHARSLEAALWTALRALEERAALSDRLSKNAASSHRDISARHFEEMAAQARDRAGVIREVLLTGAGGLHPDSLGRPDTGVGAEAPAVPRAQLNPAA